MDSSEIKNETNQDGQPEERVVMQIILTKDGSMKVNSAVLMDEMACFGILEKAKQTIIEHHKQIRSKLVKPDHRIMDFLRNGKRS